MNIEDNRRTLDQPVRKTRTARQHALRATFIALALLGCYIGIRSTAAHETMVSESISAAQDAITGEWIIETKPGSDNVYLTVQRGGRGDLGHESRDRRGAPRGKAAGELGGEPVWPSAAAHRYGVDTRRRSQEAPLRARIRRGLRAARAIPRTGARPHAGLAQLLAGQIRRWLVLPPGTAPVVADRARRVRHCCGRSE